MTLKNEGNNEPAIFHWNCIIIHVKFILSCRAFCNLGITHIKKGDFEMFNSLTILWVVKVFQSFVMFSLENNFEELPNVLLLSKKAQCLTHEVLFRKSINYYNISNGDKMLQKWWEKTLSLRKRSWIFLFSM